MAGTEGKRPADRVGTKNLDCPSCGGPIELRGFAKTKTLACEYCGSTVDTSTDAYELIEETEEAKRKSPIELGAKGELFGKTWQAIGYMRRSVLCDGTRYRWDEVLLFNPYHGNRYVVISNGHFMFVEPLPGKPTVHGNTAAYEGETYKHFTTANARVDYVLGEFPWEVRKGDRVTATDYVCPPHVLSEEANELETTYSRGTYIGRDEIEKAFGKVRNVGSPSGVAPGQPNPMKAEIGWFVPALGVAFALWFLVCAGYVVGSQSKQVAVVQVPQLTAADITAPEKPVTVSEQFVLDSSRDPATLKIDGHANVSNSWVYLDMMLIDKESETAIPLGLEISYYHGSDWTEGSRTAEVTIGDVPNGTYVLQIMRITGTGAATYNGPVQLSVHRDVWLFRYPCCAFFLIILVPLFYIGRYAVFEQRRWAESDHAGG